VVDKLSLNLGCGERTYKEYPDGYKCINYDERNLPNVDQVGDVKKLPFPNEYFHYILASDIIEHFPISMTAGLIKEWSRVLVRGGVMEIRTPNFKWAVEHYIKNRDAKFVSFHIFGGQDYPGNFHYVIFDRFWLKNGMLRNGFKEVSYEEEGSNFIMKVEKV